ncbi:MAG TPA: carboxypeptidase-like regulatory domain-containing protein [Longimicrobium sp.]|nr:carboxypeptidase-like regulatory domain-containing protein [Longimicrobium sp.]
MSPAIVGTRRHTATVVLRPVDALREALRRPPHERGPLGRVRVRVAGRVVGGEVQPLPPGSVRTVRNLSGDTVLVDLSLPAGTYRVELERDPRERRDGYYDDLDPQQFDLQWDPDAPPPGLPDGTPHVTTLVELRLRPSPLYPFPAGTTLVRGTLFWYDGAPLRGAVVREPAALLGDSRVDARGGFVVPFPANAGGPAVLEIVTAGVVGVQDKPDGAAYLQGWPLWPTPLRRGNPVSVRQPALQGTVLDPRGRLVAGARVTVHGRPGTVYTGGDGEWRYHFPPATPAGAVDVRVEHAPHAPVQLQNVPFAADATSQAPVVRLN